MNETILTKPHWSFWVIAVLALVWNLMGCANYFMQMGQEYVASLPESYQTIVVDRPAWATGAFAITVFAAVIGCILLLLRKSYALYALALSLIATVGVLIHTIIGVWGTDSASVLVSTSLSFVVALVLVWYADLATKKNWIS